MAMVVRTNINSMNANRNLSINNSQVAKAIEKLASGYAINRAADDASGLAISEKMAAQITGLDQGTENSLDGVCLVQTAEGAMQEIHNMLNRITELATKSANGTIQNEVDREAIQAEVDVLIDEIDRIALSTNYNGIPLLDGSLAGCSGSGNGSIDGTDSSGGTDGTVDTANGSVELNIDTSKTATVGTFTITGGVEGTDFTYSGGVLTILSSTHMRIEGGSNAESIVVDDVAGSANLALNNVNIISSSGSAFSTGNNDVYIELEGNNELSLTKSNSAGLNVGEFGSITIDGAGQLNATGGNSGAGIGSDSGGASGDITINGGTINATSGNSGGAAIGSGYQGNVGDITINGGFVTATSNSGGSAIGSGDSGNAKNIIITGGIITATCGDGAHGSAGIGTGIFGTVGDITITNGIINAIGGTSSAGIGTGRGGTAGDITYVKECVTATGGAAVLIWDAGEDIGIGHGGKIGTITTIPYTPPEVEEDDTDSETTTTTCGQGLILHVADQNESFNKIKIYIDPMTGEALKIKPLYVDTQDLAGAAIDIIRNAINYVSTNRANLGAMQNRLEKTINANNCTSENMTSAKSTIKDCDMAKEMVEYTKMGVLTQSAQSMLAQTNQAPQSILSLLG